MKKFIALILTLFSAIFILTGCGEQSLKLDEKYWQTESLTGNFPVDELSVYDVAVTNRLPSNSTEIKNERISLIVDEGIYTVHFKSDSTHGAEYKLQTSLTIKGKYKIGEDEYPIDNVTTATTYLKKFEEKLEPIYTEKYVKNTTLIEGNQEYVITEFEYDYTVSYGDKATVKFNVKEDKFNSLALHKGEQSYSDYKKGAFVENEAIFFIPRTFNITQGYNQNFKTLDVVSRKIQNCSYSSMSGNSDLGLTTFPLTTYKENGIEKATDGTKNVSTAKLIIELTDKYSGAEIEAYYATDYTEMRHNLVKLYTALNANMGYLEYTLKEVTLN